MKNPWKVLAMGLAISVALILPVRAEQSTPWEPLEHRLMEMRGQVRSLSARFKNRVVGGGIGSAASGAVDELAPAMLCCSLNLERMGKHLEAMEEMLDRLAQGFERPPTPNRTALGAIDRMRASLDQLREAVDSFAVARDRDGAQSILSGIHRAFLDLRASADALVLCCPPPPKTDWFDVGAHALDEDESAGIGQVARLDR